MHGTRHGWRKDYAHSRLGSTSGCAIVMSRDIVAFGIPRVDGWREFAPPAVCVVAVSAVLVLEAASLSTERLVSDRVQPILDSGPDTVRRANVNSKDVGDQTRPEQMTRTKRLDASTVPEADQRTVM